MTYQTRDGDVLDAICATHYGTENLSYIVTQVLEANLDWLTVGPFIRQVCISLYRIWLRRFRLPITACGIKMADQIVKPEYAPAFSVSAEGKDITRALQQCTAELTLTDYGGATAKADELKITLLSETLPFRQKARVFAWRWVLMINWWIRAGSWFPAWPAAARHVVSKFMPPLRQ